MPKPAPDSEDTLGAAPPAFLQPGSRGPRGQSPKSMRQWWRPSKTCLSRSTAAIAAPGAENRYPLLRPPGPVATGARSECPAAWAAIWISYLEVAGTPKASPSSAAVVRPVWEPAITLARFTIPFGARYSHWAWDAAGTAGDNSDDRRRPKIGARGRRWATFPRTTTRFFGRLRWPARRLFDTLHRSSTPSMARRLQGADFMRTGGTEALANGRRWRTSTDRKRRWRPGLRKKNSLIHLHRPAGKGRLHRGAFASAKNLGGEKVR